MVMRRPGRGQASLEMAFALFGAMMLFLATVKIFYWFAARVVQRQRYYECTRKIATSKTWAKTTSRATVRNIAPVWNNKWTDAINGEDLGIFDLPVTRPPLKCNNAGARRPYL